MGPGFLIDDYADSSSTVLDQSGSVCKGEAWMMRAFILLTSRMSGGLKGTAFLFPGPTAGPGDLIISDVQLPACVGFRIPVALPHYPSPPPTPPRFFPSELLQSKPSLQQGPGVHAHSILLISRLLSVYARNSRTSFATIQPIRKSPRSHSTNDWRGTKQNIDSSVRTIWCSNSAGATLPFWATGV
ncbi:hypothetical protein ASPTUDRAFT_55452 [Aspergillus tubingensis CBS 134.48]|uniref:Uncharacterized protein n=1 Tax=Aspergillus tubingensis (strain CBS 134.48) TaxID=767770 RepID=A0A1L9N9I6_ASPTC|nr:hypothetical protein ASPTUDRAFT_55452 [Aspergillus tubingensis CBS 134.48]